LPFSFAFSFQRLVFGRARNATVGTAIPCFHPKKTATRGGSLAIPANWGIFPGIMSTSRTSAFCILYALGSTASGIAKQPLRTLWVKFTLVIFLLAGSALNIHAAASNSIARVWMERALAAIRVDTPHPPAQARNYLAFSVCMYDSWAAYDPVAVGYIYRGKHTVPDIASARSNTLSYAVYRMMKERHAFSRSAQATLAADDALMTSLGYNINNQSRDTATPTGVGNTIYDQVSLWFSNDGSRGTNGTPYPTANPPVAYPDYPVGHPRRYIYTNPALATDRPGLDDGFGQTIVDINHWQRLNVVNAVDQNGFPTSPQQNYLGAQWLWVRPVSLQRPNDNSLWIDPGPPPFFGGASHAQFVKEVVEVIRASSQLTVDDGETIDISPGVYGNNSLNDPPSDWEFPNVYDGHGHPTNPFTGQPYAPNVVKRGDYARAIAEFWADGPNSETPPGHWNVVANDVSDSPFLVKRIGGTGPIVDDLEWDVKLYLGVNAATHDAAVACWSVKRFYDGWRPMSAVRYLGGLGQSSNPAQASYNANGLPLITNLIELVSSASIASGRHAGLRAGKIAILAWPGETPQRTAPNGVHFIHADTWTTYQRSNFVVPAFPGYISGHSTFSRSAAELLTEFTGSEFFPGGLTTYTISALATEKGPSQAVPLRYATYNDAADGAGLSRIWGGIHPNVDNMGGRRVGAIVGKDIWDLLKRYWDGSITNTPLTITQLNSSQYECRFTALRGFQYDMQSSPSLSQTFTNDPPPTSQPFDQLTVTRTNSFAEQSRFHRVVTR
jgi:hypothetical protein